MGSKTQTHGELKHWNTSEMFRPIILKDLDTAAKHQIFDISNDVVILFSDQFLQRLSNFHILSILYY